MLPAAAVVEAALEGAEAQVGAEVAELAAQVVVPAGPVPAADPLAPQRPLEVARAQLPPRRRLNLPVSAKQAPWSAQRQLRIKPTQPWERRVPATPRR